MTEDCVDVLRSYNAWRRGGDIPQPSPSDIGTAIDDAIEELEYFRGVVDYAGAKP